MYIMLHDVFSVICMILNQKKILIVFFYLKLLIILQFQRNKKTKYNYFILYSKQNFVKFSYLICIISIDCEILF